MSECSERIGVTVLPHTGDRAQRGVRTITAPRPAPARRERTGRYRRLLARVGRAVRAAHAARAIF
jgi:hypothetical protein